MDLRPIKTPATEQERAAVDAVLGERDVEDGALSTARARRHLLLPALHAAQARAGWVSPGALGYICQRLHIPPAEGFSVASFYALFALAERPPSVLHVCTDVACKVAGADALCQELERRRGTPGTLKNAGTWLESPCLGLCDRAPAGYFTRAGDEPFERSLPELDPEVAALHLDGGAAAVAPPPRLPQAGEPGLRLLARAAQGVPPALDDYRAHGGYRALGRALDLGADGVLREVVDSGLVGRGGAAFPTGRKWEAVARATTRPRYVVCNADESEPGTFKDRVLMELDPFAIVEAMTIAGFAVGAEHGYLYIRAEYPLAMQRLESAIAQARDRGLLGANVLGRGISFDIEVRRGAGAYICGEETALFNSIEGFRGEPRTKPPFPVQAGLFGRPTLVNNVESLANIPFIIEHGAKAFRSVGTDESPGTRLFCLSGRVVQPGLYELPLGVTLRELIERAGGVPGGRAPSAVLVGGAAGTFVGAEALDLPLSFEHARKAGVTLGSGVALVLDDTVPVAPLLGRIAAFFRDESCGQCVPCRVGTVRQEELVARLSAGTPRGSLDGELALLAELGRAMRDASICGLGQTASAAIESAVQRLGVWKGERP